MTIIPIYDNTVINKIIKKMFTSIKSRFPLYFFIAYDFIVRITHPDFAKQ